MRPPAEPTRTRPRSRRTGGRLARAVLAVLMVVLAGAAAAELAARHDGPVPGAVVDLDGRAVVLDPAPDPAAADPRPLPGRFVAPAVGLDVPLAAMRAVDGVINPPTATDAFLLDGFGTPGEPGTGLVVAAMHAVRGGNAPGNALAAVGPHGSVPVVAVGDRIVVAGVTYAVTGTRVLDKAAAATDPAVWADAAARDGELVVLTCLPRSGQRGAATENLVVHARAVP